MMLRLDCDSFLLSANNRPTNYLLNDRRRLLMMISSYHLVIFGNQRSGIVQSGKVRVSCHSFFMKLFFILTYFDLDLGSSIVYNVQTAHRCIFSATSNDG